MKLNFVGKHVINLFVQFTPYKPNDGIWDDPAYRVSFIAENTLAILSSAINID